MSNGVRRALAQVLPTIHSATATGRRLTRQATVLATFMLASASHGAEGADSITDWFAGTNEAVTPSHVYQATRDLISEIQILRRELGTDDYPVEAEMQEDRAPIHVYAKTLEVLGKVSRVQRRLGLPPATVGQIPIKEVMARDVLQSVANILLELRGIKQQMVIDVQVEPAAFVGGKTPSMVYKNLADASFMLDGLSGRPLTPNDVFSNMEHMADELELIAAKLQVRLRLDGPPVEGRKTVKDVAQQVLRASYKVVNLQVRLGMEASTVPSLTLVRVTPAEVFDATNMLLSELTRIKLHLGINVPREARPEPRLKTPSDVFGRVLLTIHNLDLMIEAAGG